MLPIISLGPLSLPTAPLILLFGFWLGSILSEKKAGSRRGSSEAVEKILWAALIAGLVGARLSFIARNPAAFRGNLLSLLSLNPALLDPLSGILVSTAISYYLVSKNSYHLPELLDDLTPFLGVLLIAIHLSRFATGSGFGISTNLPWGINLWGATRHPVQLYYAVSGLAVVLSLYSGLLIKIAQPGREFLHFLTLTMGYLTFFSAFQDPGPYIIGGFHAFQVLYFLVFACALILDHFIYRDHSYD